MKCVEGGEVDGGEACLGHGRDSHEKAVDIGNWGCGRSGGGPEEDRGKEGKRDEVRVVESEEVQGRAKGPDLSRDDGV